MAADVPGSPTGTLSGMTIDPSWIEATAAEVGLPDSIGHAVAGLAAWALEATALGHAPALGSLKLGGPPDMLTDGADWPADRDGRPMAFLAQIPAADMAIIDGWPAPQEGLASFFLPAQEIHGPPEPGPEQPRVVWTVASADHLERREPPPGTPILPECALAPRRVLTIPMLSVEPAAVLRPLRIAEEDGGSWKLWDAYDVLAGSLRDVQERRDAHQIGGWAPGIQTDPLEDCVERDQELDGAQDSDPRKVALTWQHLLTVGTYSSPQALPLGDGGHIVFAARHSDTAALRLDRVRHTIQSH